MKIHKNSTFTGFVFVAMLAMIQLSDFTARAQLLDSEGFNYSPETGAAFTSATGGGTGWTDSSWSDPATPPWRGSGTIANGQSLRSTGVVTPGLTYPGLSTSGNALGVVNSSYLRAWNPSSLFAASGNSLWVSLLINPGSVNTVNINPLANIDLTQANWQSGSGVLISGAAGTVKTTMNTGGYGTTTTYVSGAPLAIAQNAVSLVVMEFTWNGGVGTDTEQIWVDPTLGGSMPLGTDPTTTSTGYLDQGGYFMIRGGSTFNGILDEINIGDTFSDVTPGAVPEPSTGAMLIFGFVIGGGIFLRRKLAV
jgi:hypothetical protein